MSKVFKIQIVALMLGFSTLFVYGQEAAQREPQLSEPTATVATMIKEVLGQLYMEVEHIPESQWFEMEPIAEKYVNALLKAQSMTDGKAASRLVSDARKEYEAAIDAKLTEAQKSKRVQHLAKQRAWLEEVETQFPIAIESAQSEYGRAMEKEELERAKGGNDSKEVNKESSVKSFRYEYK